MKKLAFLVVMTAGVISLQGQAVFPDGGFETWIEETCSDESQKDPNKYWDFPSNNFITTLNKLYDMTPDLGIAPLTVFREETNVHSGNFALKLFSDTMVVANERIFLPGVAATFYVDIANVACILGKPFTSKPVRLRGYKWYEPINGDSAAIEIWTQKNGQRLSHGKQVFTATDNDYVEFDILLDQSSTETPDTIVVIFASSGNYDFTDITTLMDCEGQRGSTMYVDNVSFEYENGVQEFLTSPYKVSFFPNPAKEEIHLSVEKDLNATVVIYDHLARKVGQCQLNNGKADLNISAYCAGQYLINVVENGKVITSGRFVKD
jgi:hypothetical protein